MHLQTHRSLDRELTGRPVSVDEGAATVEMEVTPRMAADEEGLAHGGFLFGLADHAAMLAVNEPTVVLGSAEVRFLKPVTIGDLLRAEARVTEAQGRKRRVEATVTRAGEPVMTGAFTCLVPDRHVLGKP
jgi:uncharacterized protein (TIGR00369 family)